MGVAHTYAELEVSILKLKNELKFTATGRLVAEVIVVAGGEPRLRIGENELSEEHALGLAIWIQRVFQREEHDRSAAASNEVPTDRLQERKVYSRYDDSSYDRRAIR